MVKKKYSVSPIVPVPRAIRDWSVFQTAIFKEIANGTRNIQVDALAGSGKTSTICEGFYHIPEKKSSLMVAFNKSIATELQSRAPASVEVKTLHGLGYAAVRQAYPKIGAPNNDKLLNHIKAMVGDDSDDYELRSNLQKIVSLAKGSLANTSEEIDILMDTHEIDTCGETREHFIVGVKNLLESTKNDKTSVDFDDMIWFPIVHGLRMRKYDRILGDECQDFNNAQTTLTIDSCHKDGRIMTVGDKGQAIYAWRGADVNAIDNIVSRLNSKRMPLSITYRCAKSIVAYANQYVPELQAADNAEEGVIHECSTEKMIQSVRPGDFILSRVNAPLLQFCLALLKARIPANIQGRDLGKQLGVLIKKSKAKDVNGLLDWLITYRDMEVSRLLKANRPTTVVEDKVECLQVLCEGTNSLVDVYSNLDHLFKDGDDSTRVILSSTHKAKGLERDRVFMLKDTYRPNKGQEERNLAYVACTRARKELFLVSGK